MAVYSVSMEGVNALRVLARSLRGACGDIAQCTQNLLNTADEHSGGLGPHYASIYSVSRDILIEVKNAQGPVEEIAEMLEDVADEYDEIVGDDRIGNNAPSAGPSQPSGAPQGQPSGQNGGFSGVEVGRLKNGSAVIKGPNYERYVEDYYNYGDFEFTPSEGTVVETVSPSTIEGIRLGDTEAEDPNVFWQMHSSDEDFYTQTAALIPEVRAQLDSGRSLEELEDDPRLGGCASLYFDPKNIPRVEKYDGYYTFVRDGRHRIIAAREQGFDIPVVVTGTRTRRT